MFCSNCGTSIADDAIFCHNCGTAIPNSTVTDNNNDNSGFVQTTFKFLKWEYRMWLINFIAMCIMAPLVLLVLVFSDGSDPLGTVESVVNLFTFVPTLVVSVIMMTKTKKLLLPVLSCNTEAFKYCNSVSGIVLGALFNEPALVFHIINFVRMKASKRELDGILNPEHQSATVPSSQGLSAASPAAQAVPNDDDDI